MYLMSQVMQKSIESGVDIHPSVLGNFDCCKKGGVHQPRSYVKFAIECSQISRRDLVMVENG